MSAEKNSEKNRKNYNCEPCNFTTSNKSEYDRHILRRKHLYLTSPEKNTPKKPNYECKLCNFETNKKHDYSRHCMTRKHKDNEKNEKNENKNEKNENEINSDKEDAQPIENTLHSIPDISDNDCDSKSITTLLVELIKENKEMRASLVELAKNQAPNHNTNSNNNTSNNFNLQFFLNETCKDAMNIDEFIKSLQVTMEDFETTGKIGFVEGITRIILNGLKQVDSTKRPIHCTDVKRETVYIKDEDTWEKEEPEKNKFKKAVNQVARMNLSQLPKWQKENPKSEILDTKENDQYVKYSLAALGGKSDEEDARFVNKIMKNIVKEVTIR